MSAIQNDFVAWASLIGTRAILARPDTLGTLH